MHLLYFQTHLIINIMCESWCWSIMFRVIEYLQMVNPKLVFYHLYMVLYYFTSLSHYILTATVSRTTVNQVLLSVNTFVFTRIRRNFLYTIMKSILQITLQTLLSNQY